MMDNNKVERSFVPADVLNAAIMGNESSMNSLFNFLREYDPVSWVEHPDYEPFWSLTKYDDVKFIGSANEEFLSAPRTTLLPIEFEKMLLEMFGTRNGLETLIHMDKPKHLKLRKVSTDWFLPRSINKLEQEIKILAKEFVDKMLDKGGKCDFVRDIAMYYPLRVILSILGLPRDSEETMLTLTQELFGGQDPALQRSENMESGLSVLTDFGDFFNKVIEEKKINPADDLASVLANATVDGEPMNTLDQMSYFIITATAGHDTTSAAISGGMKALIDHPDQMKLLRDRPDLDINAAKEMIRWTSPVRHMVRTATKDTELGGKHIKSGDNLALWYPAANRDPKNFANPNVLDFTRDAKSQLAFGYGAHICLGQHLAALEVACFFRELLPRIKEIEMNGDPEWVQAIFVGGLKSLPIRYQIT